MSQFYITNESTEDTLASAENLQDAIRLAREIAKQAQPGDPVSVEREGKTVRQFVLMPDGTIAEPAIVRPTDVSGPPAGTPGQCDAAVA